MIDGEPIIYRAKLDERFLTFRAWEGCCFGTWIGCAFTMLPFFGLPYMCCGQAYREAEASTFSLVITPSAIQFRMKKYDCAWCCQTTTSKSIPLDKVQDVMLVSNCVGDTCGFAEPGKVYQVHVQTAGSSSPGDGRGGSTAELIVFCIKNPEEFRQRVLTAKRQLLSGGAHGALAGASALAIGASKDGAVLVNPLHPGVGGDSAAVVAVLERIEKAIHDGLTHVGARSGSVSASVGGGAASALAPLQARM